MKAFVLEGPGKASLQEREIPRPEAGEALVRITAASICGSDISAFRGHGQSVPYPLILGHEAVGVIEEIGENEGGLQKGDRVILDPYLYCGHCYPCSLGRTNCCESLRVLGVQTDGAMKEYIAHPSHLLHKVPEEIPLELSPLAEPLTIALHGLHRCAVKAGEHIAIIGAGPIGLLAAMAALHYGAAPILIDIVEERLSLARELGVQYTIHAKEEDVLARISDITGGRMAEAVLEMSGSNEGIRNTLLYSSYCARIALTGWPSGETALPTSLITRKELDIRGARTSAGEFAEALELIASGKVNARAVLSDTVAFEDLPRAMQDQSDFPSKYLKITALF